MWCIHRLLFAAQIVWDGITKNVYQDLQYRENGFNFLTEGLYDCNNMGGTGGLEDRAGGSQVCRSEE